MTILHDECRPTQPTPSDAVRDLMRGWLEYNGAHGFHPSNYPLVVDGLLSALSDAGLAVLPLEATVEMMIANPFTVSLGKERNIEQMYEVWEAMAAAFHTSQLEKTDE